LQVAMDISKYRHNICHFKKDPKLRCQCNQLLAVSVCDTGAAKLDMDETE